MKRIDAYWYSQNSVAWLLLPVAALYFLIVSVRRWLYRIQILKSCSLPTPVVIVGNISVGGTGKTPLLISLCKLLKEQGYQPGIISRGYGGNFEGEHLVDENDPASMIGDEPYMIFKRTACPLVVGRDRVAAAQLLLEKKECDIILSDDGLQHYRLQRDIEIAVVDTGRGLGNGFCLPSGPLRETKSRLDSVDIVIDHCGDKNIVCRKDNFSLKFLKVLNLAYGEERTIESFSTQPVHAVAGIGHPARFFEQLRNSGLTVNEHAFPDHYAFKKKDFNFDDELPVLMTEKDAVKCQDFTSQNLWYVPVSAELSEHLVQKFLSQVKNNE